jgi:hypothetical protein
MVPAMMLLRNHEADIRAIDERLELQRHEVLTKVLERAVREGVVEEDLDVEEAISHLFGPLLFAHVTDQLTVDEAFADRVVDRFLAAHAPHAAPSTATAPAPGPGPRASVKENS